MSADRLRLFFALWPERELAGQAHALSRSLFARAERLLIPAERLHITLQFLGSRPAGELPGIEAAAAAIDGRRFALELDQVGFWKRAGVAWLGPSAAPDELFALVTDLRTALEGVGIAPEKRKFRPHMTIGRKLRGGPRRTLEAPLRWTVDHLRLVRSVTRAAGPVYTELARWRLRD